MTVKTEKKIVATIETKLGYEKKNAKGVVTSVRDYVVVGGNLWVNPELALALSKLPDLGRKLGIAANECLVAAKQREAIPRPTKATKESTTAIPALPPDTLAMFQQFMAMLTAQSATTAQQAEAEAEAVVNATEPDEPKRESAKERAIRLQQQSDKEARDRLRERSE